MRGLNIENGSLEFREDLIPEQRTGECRIRVIRAGVCSTDLALQRGYMGFNGTPGHEFIGTPLDGPLQGKRVVGEINAACGECDQCRQQLGRHCPNRSVLGIYNRMGCFADEISLPAANLLEVPDSVSDDAAVFTEPLAAAFEIQEQVALEPGMSALVVGDGRLGLLCAHVLRQNGLEVTIAGRHDEHADLVPGTTYRTGLFESESDEGDASFDIAVEATGNPDVLARLFTQVRPRGTIVLKTTSERPTMIDFAPAVIHEFTLLGSRCGRFAPALEELSRGAIDVEAMIHARFPLEQGIDAFRRATQAGTLKVLIDVNDPA